jgi:hypothetical protein
MEQKEVRVLNFKVPNGIFIDKDNNLYVADTMNKRIQKYSQGSNDVGITVVRDNQLIQPSDVFIDSVGNIFVADNGIRMWPVNSKEVVTIAAGHYSHNYYAIYGGINEGEIYATEWVNTTSRVMKYSTSNLTSGVLVGLTTSNPRGLFNDQCENIYAASTYGIIDKFIHGGSKSGIASVSDLTNPFDVILDS